MFSEIGLKPGTERARNAAGEVCDDRSYVSVRRQEENFAWLVPECLILAAVADHETQRIGKEHGIRNFVAEAVDHVGRPTLATDFLLIAWRAEDLVKLNAGAVGRFAEIFEDDGMDFHINIGLAGIKEEIFERFGLFRLDNG